MKIKVLLCIVIIMFNSVIWAQTNNENKNNYLVVYPIEALVGHLRIGFEKEFKPNKSFLLEGQYYLTDDRLENYLIPRKNYFGIALKSEMRFYDNNVKNKNKIFLGINLMIKRNENMRFDATNGYSNFVFSLNFKKGIECFINENFKLDLYYGVGIRYKTLGISPLIYFDEPKLANKLVYPNILLGLNLKFK